jgi:hypothetical protein
MILLIRFILYDFSKIIGTIRRPIGCIGPYDGPPAKTVSRQRGCSL